LASSSFDDWHMHAIPREQRGDHAPIQALIMPSILF